MHIFVAIAAPLVLAACDWGSGGTTTTTTTPTTTSSNKPPPPPPPPTDEPDTSQPYSDVTNAVSLRQKRIAAWQRDDVFAQLALGDYYAQSGAPHDTIESYVWYYLALRRDHFYNAFDPSADAAYSRLRLRAYDKACDDYEAMTLSERLQARNRIIYILSHSGADGLIVLGRLHRENPINNTGLDHDVLVHNDADALTYFEIAHLRYNHPLAKSYADALAKQLPPDVAQRSKALAANWTADDEYYQGQTDGGVLHTDESVEDLDTKLALEQVRSIPSENLRRALWASGAMKGQSGDRAAQANFQQMIGHDQTGVLTPAETVRLIQSAAFNNDAASQTELGVIYAHGYGVRKNAGRARHWFELAARQQYAPASRYLSVYSERGAQGVDQDRYKADSQARDAEFGTNAPSSSDRGPTHARGHHRHHGGRP